MRRGRAHLLKDVGGLAASLVVAFVLVQSGMVDVLISQAQEWKFVGSFLAGMLFVSVFTVALAGALLYEIAATNSLWEVALLGGLGGLLGDFLIFRFVKDHVATDLSRLLKKSKRQHLLSFFRLKLFRWSIPVLGALVVASPLPDEIGLTMMGLSKTKTRVFLPLIFALDSIGIYLMALFAKSLQG